MTEKEMADKMTKMFYHLNSEGVQYSDLMVEYFNKNPVSYLDGQSLTKEQMYKCWETIYNDHYNSLKGK